MRLMEHIAHDRLAKECEKLDKHAEQKMAFISITEVT